MAYNGSAITSPPPLYSILATHDTGKYWVNFDTCCSCLVHDNLQSGPCILCTNNTFDLNKNDYINQNGQQRKGTSPLNKDICKKQHHIWVRDLTIIKHTAVPLCWFHRHPQKSLTAGLQGSAPPRCRSLYIQLNTCLCSRLWRRWWRCTAVRPLTSRRSRNLQPATETEILGYRSHVSWYEMTHYYLLQAK